MWKTIIALVFIALVPAIAEAQTWTSWRVGSAATDGACTYIHPGVECFWYFSGGATDSPIIEKDMDCKKSYWRVRPAGGGSPIGTLYFCEPDLLKASCEVAETLNKRTSTYGDVIFNYDIDDKGAINVPGKLLLFDPTSGEGYVIVGCD